MLPPPTLNGAPATLDHFAALAASSYGVFTNLPVRAGAAQALDLHLDRLDDGACELFGRSLDRSVARRCIAQATDGADLLLRVSLFSRAFDRVRPAASPSLDLLVAPAPLHPPTLSPLRLRSVVHARHAPHLKHLGVFELWDHRRRAQAAGYDDALFVDPAGRIAEATVWNVGFHDGERFVWPDAPALDGVGQRLLRRGLDRLGVGWTTRPLALADLPSMQFAFLSNALDPVRPVLSIDAQGFVWDEALSRTLQQALATEPWERL